MRKIKELVTKKENYEKGRITMISRPNFSLPKPVKLNVIITMEQNLLLWNKIVE